MNTVSQAQLRLKRVYASNLAIVRQKMVDLVLEDDDLIVVLRPRARHQPEDRTPGQGLLFVGQQFEGHNMQHEKLSGHKHSVLPHVAASNQPFF